MRAEREQANRRPNKQAESFSWSPPLNLGWFKTPLFAFSIHPVFPIRSCDVQPTTILISEGYDYQQQSRQQRELVLRSRAVSWNRRSTMDNARHPDDRVEEASEESFPASD